MLTSGASPLLTVHVFRVAAPEIRDVRTISGVSGEERQRAAGIPDLVERGRFLAARRALRNILGRELGCRPEQVPIRTTANGKPELAASTVSNTLHFSVTRRDRFHAVATSYATPVGVDVEVVRPLTGRALVVQDHFPLDVRAALDRAAEPARSHEFVLWWTRIEAAVKACDATLDAAARCLQLAPQDSTFVAEDAAVSVAAMTPESFSVEWRIHEPPATAPAWERRAPAKAAIWERRAPVRS